MKRMPIHIITTRGALFEAATLGLQSLSKLKNDEESTVSLVLFSSRDEMVIDRMKRRSEWQRILNRR